jgi:Family of unknown function (DUF6134)
MSLSCRARGRYTLTGALLLFVPPLGEATDALAHRWHFTVLLDERVIGRHDFSVRAAAQGETLVVSDAAFTVTALRIPFYRYAQSDREHWRDGCLHDIEAVTDDNGTRLQVSGAAMAGGLQLTSPSGTQLLPGCIRTYAYWSRDAILGAGQLLNSQNGELEPVTTQSTGVDTITTGGRTVSAERVTLKSPRYSIELWYASSGEWLALRTPVSGGRILRYEIRN